MIPTHLLTSGRFDSSKWPTKSAPVTHGNRMTRTELEQILKIQIGQVQSMMTGQGCDSFNRTVCAHRGETIPVLYPARKDPRIQRAGNALDNALGRPTALSIKNPRPLLQMISPEELAAARAEAEAEVSEPGSPLRKAHGSWRMAMMRTIEDCHSCIVEYEDLKWMDQSDASPSDKAEMRALMVTLVDRVFSTFTAGEGPEGSSINDDVLVTIAGIAKGRRLLGRILALLEGARRDEFMRAVLRNLARISVDLSKHVKGWGADETGAEEQKLVSYLSAGCSEMDLSSVRAQLLAAYQVSKDLDARNLFATPLGCTIVGALLKRGLHCISIGKSEERSRMQWQSAVKDVLMFCTMHCVAICAVGEDKTAVLRKAGSELVSTVVEAYKPYMSDEQGAELSMCFTSQGLDASALGFS